ncbi:MAG TPA: HPF/RaiA family ribosome-associated protein [Chloroflexota bacterium]|nr:HPF/RaiA family ribosome-associated protein [Chloroflexota bacterium]
MTLEIKVQSHGLVLDETEERRIRERLEGLGRRLARRPEPTAVLVLTSHGRQRQVQADLRVHLGPLGPTLVSHQAGDTTEHSVRLAVTDIERQLERRTAAQRGEPAYGVPSRRLPAQLRPNPPRRSAAGEQETEMEEPEA